MLMSIQSTGVGVIIPIGGSNMFTNLNLSDIETCYKVFKADILKNLLLTLILTGEHYTSQQFKRFI